MIHRAFLECNQPSKTVVWSKRSQLAPHLGHTSTPRMAFVGGADVSGSIICTGVTLSSTAFLHSAQSSFSISMTGYSAINVKPKMYAERLAGDVFLAASFVERFPEMTQDYASGMRVGAHGASVPVRSLNNSA